MSWLSCAIGEVEPDSKPELRRALRGERANGSESKKTTVDPLPDILVASFFWYLVF